MSAIAMHANDPWSFHRPMAAFENARSAFKAVLAQAARFKRRTVLLPAYIGWSHREGSGVFDPVRELGLSYQFYQVDHELRIDLEDLRRQLEAHSPSVLLLIHYFGYIDPGYPKAAELAQRHDAVLVEDEAHAMLTDLVGGACGRLGDVCLFSF